MEGHGTTTRGQGLGVWSRVERRVSLARGRGRAPRSRCRMPTPENGDDEKGYRGWGFYREDVEGSLGICVT
ncbi:hypothetical protein Hanom_Chr08g00710331 [Helianthus anomalus]